MDERSVEAANEPKPSSGKGHRVLYRAFGNANAYLDDLYSVHRRLYASLPTFRYEEVLTERSLYEYCQAKKYYILIIPYTDDKNVVLERAFAGNKLSWSVLGGSVKAALNDNYVNAVQRLISRYVDGMLLGEIEPVAFLENLFRHGDDTHYHLGIAFIARVRNQTPRKLVVESPSSRVFLAPTSVDPFSIGLSHHRAVFEHAQPRLQLARDFSIQEDEIGINRKYRWRYRFHSLFVKPFFSVLSKFFYKYSISDYKKRIEEILTAHGCQSLLDVACGDNFSIIDFAVSGKIPLVVGNDISWSQVELMNEAFDYRKFRNSESLVLFTNHDSRRLPFDDNAFDCVICQNVLHHMPDQASVAALLREVRRVGKRALVVEVLDPKYENAWGRLRHRYYLRFLHDAGIHFLSREEFDIVTAGDDRDEKFEMPTVRGIYQFAVFGNGSRI